MATFLESNRNIFRPEKQIRMLTLEPDEQLTS